jgi:hypothetical protein
LKFFILLIFLFSCRPKEQSQIDLALEKKDTALAKKLAQKELDRMRASLTDSNFATTLDAMLLLQNLKFTLQKADTSRVNTKFSDEYILNHRNGERLYKLMQKLYERGLKQTINSSDIKYFSLQLSLDETEWLKQRFANKKTYEILISLHHLQKDMALISAIESHVDTKSLRQELEKSYGELDEIMQRGH